MKKIIISGLVLATFLTPSLAQAQVTPIEVQLESLKQQLIELLLEQIAMLQAQIEQLIAQQAQTDVRIAQVEAVEPIVLGSTETVIGQAFCNPDDPARGTIRIPLNIGGSWGSARVEITFPNGDVMKHGWRGKPTIFQTQARTGTSTIRVYTAPDESAIQTIAGHEATLTLEQEMFIGDLCE